MYRKNICVVLIDDAREHLLMFRRVGAQDYYWQFPQGGIDTGESDTQAMYRELKEEIGTNDVEILKIAESWIKYDFPGWVQENMRNKGHKPLYQGQEQRWYLARLKQGTASIRFDYQPAEFDGFEWVEPQRIIERVIPFKRPAYTQGLKALGVF